MEVYLLVLEQTVAWAIVFVGEDGERVEVTDFLGQGDNPLWNSSMVFAWKVLRQEPNADA